MEKRQKSDENPVQEVQSPKTIPNLPKLINSKHCNLEEDFDMRKQLPFRGLRKNRRIIVTCEPSEELKLNSSVFMKFYSGYSKLRTNIVTKTKKIPKISPSMYKPLQI